MASVPSGWTSPWSSIKRWVIRDPSLDIESLLFQGICLLSGVLAIFVLLPVNNYPNLSPWVNRGLLCFGLIALGVAWAARQGHFFRKTMFFALVACLDFLWFPNGGSNGSVGSYFFFATFFLVLFLEGYFRYVGLALLVANVIGLHLAEWAWPSLVIPYTNSTSRLLDLMIGYLIGLPICAVMLWAIQAGFHRRSREVKEALGALQASEERFRLVFQHMPVALSIIDIENGCCLEVNQAFESHFGYTSDELNDRRSDAPRLWANPEECEKILDALRRGQPVQNQEVAFRRKDGSLRWVSYSGEIVDLNATSCLISSAVDITLRKDAQEALRESNELFSLFLRCSPIHAYIKEVTATQSRVLHASENFEQMIGIPGSSMQGKAMEELFPAAMATKMSADDWSVVSAGERLELEEEFNGRSYTTLKFPIVLGEKTLLAGFTIDITESRQAEAAQRQLEARLQQAEKMESLGRLAGGVAHDMNNVLGAILGIASANLELHPEESRVFKAFHTISKAAVRGGDMVKRLLGLARPGPLDEQDLDLNAVLRDQIHLLERTTLSRVNLEADLAPDLRIIRGDASALSHAFMNLFVNAVDAMPEGGTLTLRSRNLGDDWVEARVEDTGSGMTKDVLAKALDPFFTTKDVGKGTGLGLSMVYNTLKSHRGRMEIQSQPGRGTCVLLQFPSSRPVPMDSLLSPEDRISPIARSLRVLVVDDDELVQQAVQGILNLLGHQVVVASGGMDALAALEAGDPPDVVILDMNMPGLDGAGTLPRIRALRPGLPVVLATGRVDQRTLDLIGAHPGTVLLSKPFTLKEIKKVLEPLQQPAISP